MRPTQLEAAEVVLAVRVVVLRERFEGGDLLERGSFYHVRKLAYGCRHEDLAAGEALPEGVIELPDAGGLVNGLGIHRQPLR